MSPSKVNPKSASKISTLKLCAPVPISSSGVNATQICPCGIFSVMIRSNIVIISAIPALSSAPKTVVPSVVIRVRPFKEGR